MTWDTSTGLIVETYAYGETVEGFIPEPRFEDSETHFGMVYFLFWVDMDIWEEVDLPFTMPARNMMITVAEEFNGWCERPGSDECRYWTVGSRTMVAEWFCVNDKAELVTDGSGDWYYARDWDGIIVYDITEIEGVLYAFNHENGVFLKDYTGIYEAKNGDLYYVENGIAVANKGLVKTVDDNGHYG